MSVQLEALVSSYLLTAEHDKTLLIHNFIEVLEYFTPLFLYGANWDLISVFCCCEILPHLVLFC